MFTKQALRELDVRSAITATQKQELNEQDFFAVDNVVSPSAPALMRDEFERIHTDENNQGGHEVHVDPGARRVSKIFSKGSALGVPEQKKVLELIGKLSEPGVPVVLISHNLPDVFAVADRLVMMHRGRKVTEKKIGDTNSEEVVQYMVGALDDTRATAPAG